jgi:hypothetical protein
MVITWSVFPPPAFPRALLSTRSLEAWSGLRTNDLSDTKTVTITVDQAASSPGQPFGVGLGPELWLAAGVIALVAALVSILAIRARRGKKGIEEGAKP